MIDNEYNEVDGDVDATIGINQYNHNIVMSEH